MERPSRARVFEKYGIDYCCGGKLPLERACEKKKIDPAELIRSLALFDEASLEETDWNRASFADLIANLVNVHHAYLREELPALSALVHKVARVHGESHPELALVHQVYECLKAELASHMLKEERILFPFCLKLEEADELPESTFGTVGRPIEAMEHEHDDAGRALERLRQLTNGFTPPEGACNSYRAMLDRLQALETDLHLHIHKENNVLFPRTIALEERLGKEIA